MITPKLSPCPTCGRVPDLDAHNGYYSISCENCYDGAPDAGWYPLGSGQTAIEAAEEWNMWVADAYDQQKLEEEE